MDRVARQGPALYPGAVSRQGQENMCRAKGWIRPLSQQEYGVPQLLIWGPLALWAYLLRGRGYPAPWGARLCWPVPQGHPSTRQVVTVYFA